MPNGIGRDVPLLDAESVHRPIPAWSFEFTSSCVIRASSFSNLLAHHLFLLGARVSLLSADQAALTQFDQSIIH